MRWNFISVVSFFILSITLLTSPVFAASAAVDYLCEFGIAFYQRGRYDDALKEFQKVLILDPDNQTAQQYISTIFQKENPPLKEGPAVMKSEKPPLPQAEIKEKIKEGPPQGLTKEEAMEKALGSLGREPKQGTEEEEKAFLSGEYRLSLGVTPHDVIWKDANADRIGVPREKNWRYLWGDQRENTYDPKIYDRFRVAMQTKFDSPLNAFMEITIDPWTFVGKNHVTIPASSGSDSANMDLLYWSNEKRTINQTYRSEQGQIINLKQIKVHDGKTTLSGLTIVPTNATFGAIQPMDINRDYRPIRKFWVDYKQGDCYLKVFPISDQYEALTSDDPLKISNNRVYWEESPWLDEYEPSRTFVKANEPIKAGRWIRKLSFFSKDSSDDYPHRLTFLRGVSFKTDSPSYNLEATVATPLSLWDEYDRADSVDSAVKLSVPLDEWRVGFTTTSKLGLNGGSLEAENHAGAFDFGYQWNDVGDIYGEVAASHTNIEEAKGFSTSYDGVGAKLGFRYLNKEGQGWLERGEVYLAHLDGNFYPGLSNYRYTRRDDPTLSRHIYFSEVKKEDKDLIWGDGIDRGRKVAGFNLNTNFLDDKINSDIQYRNVHRDSGKYLESVLRSESTYTVNPRLTSKLLAYYQHLPKTHANYDPVIYKKTTYSLTDYFSEDDSHPTNAAVIDDKDPSIGAFGLGAKYKIIEDLVSMEGVYERTNDPLNFPRGLLNDVTVTTEIRDGVAWDKVEPYLYDQKFFDMPPYSYYNIAKVKFDYTPTGKLEFILRYTYNENKFASGIDDNINHAALEINYYPSDKLTFWFKYIYSRLIDVYRMNKEQRSDYYESHNNFFFGSEYKFSRDESFTLLYGEFVGYNDPYQQTNWTLSALDTQHIFRLFYRRKF